ncbi:MAG: hypothetical protein N3I86_04225, partial [Verrucomicrobiae bacterium]|nr:hypothetical protein [Verrucomicrobiae bacterium]
WTFVRIRGSLFFRDEERALKPVYSRLKELNIRPSLVPSALPTAHPRSELVERVIRRAAELRREWHQETSSSQVFANEQGSIVLSVT